MRKLFCGDLSGGLYPLLGTRCEHDATTWFPKERVYYVHRGRTAIRRACELLHLGPETEVLAPAYNCGAEIAPLLSRGVSVVLYQTKRSGHIDLDDLRNRITKKTRVIYVTHYFGFPQPIADIKRFCEGKSIYLIEDCALALFSCDGSTELGSTGDISIFSFPKSLPVPDGGALVINSTDLAKNDWELHRAPFSLVAKETLSLLKRNSLRSASGTRLFPLFWPLLERYQAYTRYMEPPHQALPPDMPKSFYYDEDFTDKAISRLTKRLLKTFDITTIVTKRRNNFTLLLNMLAEAKGIEPLFKTLPEGVCPLYFPVIVKNRVYLYRKLNELSIAAIEWWAGYHPALPWDEFPDACFLKDHILALPVHQQLNLEHITFIARKFIDVCNKLY